MDAAVGGAKVEAIAAGVARGRSALHRVTNPPAEHRHRMANDLRSEGRAARRERLLELADSHGLAGIVLRRPANFAWYTGGADSRVDRSVPDGVADLLVTPRGDYVVTTTTEAPRIRTQQTPAFEVVEHPWDEEPAAAARATAV